MELDRKPEDDRLLEIKERLQMLRTGFSDVNHFFDYVISTRKKYIDEIKALEDERESLIQGQLILPAPML